MPRLMVGTD